MNAGSIHAVSSCDMDSRRHRLKSRTSPCDRLPVVPYSPDLLPLNSNFSLLSKRCFSRPQWTLAIGVYPNRECLTKVKESQSCQRAETQQLRDAGELQAKIPQPAVSAFPGFGVSGFWKTEDFLCLPFTYAARGSLRCCTTLALLLLLS